jgi:hypothetical protein
VLLVLAISVFKFFLLVLDVEAELLGHEDPLRSPNEPPLWLPRHDTEVWVNFVIS